MSETSENESTPDEPTESTPDLEKSAGWFVFDEKMVQIQVREPYIGVNYSRTVEGAPYKPTTTPEGAVRATPVLSGTLFVKPSGTPSGLILILRTQIGDSSDFALISIHPEDVLNCTHIHQSRIVTPA